ncbi:sulfatase-like hydrolase/transferase [Polaribacter sp.]|nr:sulfatase-like hydrolase/transferase [Polaribacter sp.]
MKKQYFKTLILLSTLLFTVSNYAQTQGSRPNIILILADDLGYADVGFNRDGTFPTDRGVIPTPNIDALANSGIILKNAHVAHPFCGPSRVALLTGMMPHRIGAQYNLPNDITTTLGIPENETYFTELLQNSNYNTSAIGKWHLGFEEGKYQPLDRGFDHFFGFLGGGKGYFEEGYEDNFYNRLGGSNPVTNEYQDPLQRNRDYVTRNEYSNVANEDYLTDILTDNAIQYIADNKGKSDPFFMYLAYNAPHTPLEATDAEVAQFKADNPDFENLIRNSDYITKSTPVEKLTTQSEKDDLIDKFVEARIIYATMTVNMDKNIGRVVDELKKDINDFNNTVIIFLSDNGGYTYSKGAVNWPLDALKGSVKEGGHKVPMFVSWPNKITTPSTYNHQISSLDIYPTVLDLAGATVPQSKIIDGVSFMDKVISGDNARPKESLIIMRPQNGFHNGGITYDNWKITKTGNNGTWNLYNVLTDPGETTNIRSTEPNGDEIVQEILDEAIAVVADFKEVKPAWYDNDRFDIDGDGVGDGHVHSFLWADGTLPGYDRLFETPSLAQAIQITVTGNTNATEGETNGVFTVGFSNGAAATEDIEVTYVVGGSATEGTDYTTIARTVTIADGDSSAEITIEAIQDNLDEDPETVTITLQSSSVESVNTTVASIDILDVVVNETSDDLTAGDIAIVGYKAAAGNVGELAFVILKDINAGTSISFSNRGWHSDGSFNLSGSGVPYGIDDVFSWTTINAYTAGTIFKLGRNGKVSTVINDIETEVGTTVQTLGTDGDWDLSPAGDTVLIYSGDTSVHPADDSLDWITGLNTDGKSAAAGWATGGGNAYCELPNALVDFNIDVTGKDPALNLWDLNYGVYSGAATGSSTAIRASVNNYANWSLSETNEYSLWSIDDSVNTVSGDINLGQITLSATVENISAFKVYPNPVSETFTVKLNNTYKSVQIEILSVTGKLIQKINSNNSTIQNIDASNLSSGIYLVRVNADNNFSIKKVIKI